MSAFETEAHVRRSITTPGTAPSRWHSSQAGAASALRCWAPATATTWTWRRWPTLSRRYICSTSTPVLLRVPSSDKADRVKRVCHLHERDLTGVAPLIDRWRRQPPEPLTAQMEGWAALARLQREAGEFDAVLSTCLLSQVAINLRDFFGLTSALNTAFLAAITGHILLAKALTKPGGRLLVTSDCITDQYPIREETSARGAVDAMWYLTKQGAAFQASRAHRRPATRRPIFSARAQARLALGPERTVLFGVRDRNCASGR